MSLAVIGVPPRLAAAPVVTVAQAALTAADAAENDNFGFSVSLGGDTALIGAPGDDTPAGINAGSARVFVRSPQGWTEHATLTAPDAVADDRLGWSVSMDGDTAAVGVPFDDLDGAINGGSVRIFARHAGVWTEQAVLTAPDPAEGDVFGFSVALSGDTVLVGAVGDDTDDGRGIGVAYTYVRSGETWPLQAELRPTDAQAGDNFGFSVGLDGDTAVVGMVGDDTTDVSEGGSARVFTRSGAQWTEQATLAASDAAPDDLFGYSVAVNRDTAVVGAVGDDTAAGVNAGSARVFARSGTAWQEVATLASGAAAPGDNLGFSVAVDRDTAIVGAVGDDQARPDAGAARIFMRVDGIWSEQPPLTAGDAVFGDNLGQSVDVDGHSAMVGAPRDNTAAGGDAGSAAMAVLDQAPTAAPDTYLVEDGNPLIVEAARGVLANDTDLDGDALTAALVDPAAGGLELQADGSFRYVPDPTAKNSRVTFAYRATDGLADSLPGEVTITSVSKQAAPLAQPTLPVTGSPARQWTLVAVALLSIGSALRAWGVGQAKQSPLT